MAEGYFSPWGGTVDRDCRTGRYSIGRPDGVHLWCEWHRIVAAFPCDLWERTAGTDDEGGKEMQLEGVGVTQPEKLGPFQPPLKFGKEAYCVVELRRG